ncbi:MAG: single-stranded DNA-binding protein [Candidatus Liptonbacteria bacterium]|nr:single-stranded DNA-binding protein [Candidatus Liptonbacteria bacterium]
MNLNKVFLIGRLTADPQLRTTPGGASVTSFGIATNRVWTDKAGAKQNETEFHNVVAWGRSAEIASQYLKKGSMAFVEGRLRTRTWQDKQGQTRRTTEIMLERLQLGPRAGEGGSSVGSQPSQGFGGQAGSSVGGSGSASTNQKPETVQEEIPTIDLDAEGKGELKEEDLPF